MSAETRQRLAEIAEREKKATVGPWFVSDQGNVTNGVYTLFITYCSGKNDTSFVTHARADIPWLLQLVKEQQKEIELLDKSHDWLHGCMRSSTEQNVKLFEENQHLQDDNQRLVETLKQYADEENWNCAVQYSGFGKAFVMTFIPNKSQPWVIAQRALAERSINP